MEDIRKANISLRKYNLRSRLRRSRDDSGRSGKLQKVLVANRGEIAKRFFQALHEKGIPSVAVVTEPDAGQSWYEFADEVVYIGEAANYTHIPTIVTAAILAGANAIYPGYGFLSENPEFVERMSAVAEHFDKELTFMGPPARVMRKVGNKLDARDLARENAVPVFEGSEAIADLDHARQEAARIGYPVLVKLDSGGGGKGMTPVFAEDQLEAAIESSRRIGRDLYGNDSLYLEKLIQRPVHIEVQIFNGLAVGIRKCAAQRRNQKIIEESGHSFLEVEVREELFAAAENMAQISGYADGGAAGTVEFLYDADSGKFGFLEMNTRLQVEYAVTDQSLGIDLATWQILYFDGCESELDYDAVRRNRLHPRSHSIECRIYAEDPENDYAPSPGTIQRLDLPTFNGVRCDFGFRAGDRVLPFYDPMIGKIIVDGEDRAQALVRLERALQELYIKGATTNVAQLLRVVRHPAFFDPDYTNRILGDNPELESGSALPAEPGADRRQSTAVLFGAFVAHIHEIRKRARLQDSQTRNSALLSDATVEELPYIYNVDYAGANFRVKFLQRSMVNFYSYVDDRFNGRISLARMAGGEDEYVIRFGSRSLHIRADRKPAYTLLRLKNREGKVQYHRMQIQPEGTGAAENAAETVRAPFQGTFVKLAEKDGVMLKVGDRVSAGQPLIVVSAMKMETTISAEIDGTLNYLIEDGDLSRLQLGQTTDGRILGKSIGEGEILALLDPEVSSQDGAADPTAGAEELKNQNVYENRRGSLLESIFGQNLETVFARNPQQNLRRAVKIMESILKGYVPHQAPADSFQTIIKQLIDGEYTFRMNRTITDQVLGILDHYVRVKRVFSSNLAGDVSYFAELNLLISQDQADDYRPSQAFQAEIEPLLAYYGYKKDASDAEEEASLLRHIFLYLFQSRSACAERRDIVECLVHLIAAAASQLREAAEPGSVERVNEIRSCIKQVLYQELSELDESLAETLRQILQKIPETETQLTASVNDDSRDMTALDAAHPLLFFGDFDLIDLHNNILMSIEGESPEPELIPALASSGRVQDQFVAKIKHLQGQGKLRRLYSPLEDVAIYMHEVPTDTETPVRLIAFSTTGDLSESGMDQSARARAVWNVVVRSLQVLFALRFVAKKASLALTPGGHRVEVFVDGPMDSTGFDDRFLSYWDLNRELEEHFSFLQITTFESALLHISDATGDRSIQIAADGEILRFDYPGYPDCPNPYESAPKDIPPPEAKLFARGKWPVDVWLREIVDAGSEREVIVPGIDRIEYTDPKTGKAGYKPVGARVYQGKIDGRPVVFFMKDSRVRGGATGNLEGLKYVAAAYLAYLEKTPLYVWNDGAGANIKEGVISLNRAAQGFMFNTLLAQNVDEETFRRYTDRSFDPALHVVISEIREQFSPAASEFEHEPLFTVAVGIGSSAGLDVYGSSQATLQVLLDSPESYRVLTGSNVIRSVTGEDITNYEIGGARIMGKWTGIADWIARDKIHLLAILRRINEMFSTRMRDAAESGSQPRSVVHQDSSPRMSLASHSVINETIISASMDGGKFWPLKQEYAGAGSMIGGLARLGGHRVMLLGMRSHFGMRASAAVIRSRELLRIASRTETARVLIFGRRWFQPLAQHEPASMRSRLDFLNTLRDDRIPQIHIVTHPEGLQLIELNCTADVVIYVQDARSSSRRDLELVRQNAAFVVDSIDAAFETTQSILDFFADARRQKAGRMQAGTAFPKASQEAAHPGGEKPSIPRELNQPYDIVERVIAPAFDPGSFLEFSAGMNDPAMGPSLVTGLARLNGVVVGILADQPAIMGGAPDAPGTEKFRVFTELLNKHGIPLVMLSNAPGFVPGTRQERLRIQQIGGESLDANVLGQIPVVSVVLNQNYGGRQIHAFSKFLRPGIAYIALEHAHIAVMGGQAAYDLFEGRRHAELLAADDEAGARENHRRFMQEFDQKSRATGDAENSGLLDWTFGEAATLREQLLRGLEAACERCAEVFQAP
ncbi:MAG: carbamoyl-phosphate synthase subunit L [bacterium]|nr:carbamoyl-phosphate synthase subunit L [bacterium]